MGLAGCLCLAWLPTIHPQLGWHPGCIRQTSPQHELRCPVHKSVPIVEAQFTPLLYHRFAASSGRPPAPGRPRGSPLLWTGLARHISRSIVGATLVVARWRRLLRSPRRCQSFTREAPPLQIPVMFYLTKLLCVRMNNKQHPLLQRHLGVFLDENIAHPAWFPKIERLSMQWIIQTRSSHATSVTRQWKE